MLATTAPKSNPDLPDPYPRAQPADRPPRGQPPPPPRGCAASSSSEETTVWFGGLGTLTTDLYQHIFHFRPQASAPFFDPRLCEQAELDATVPFSDPLLRAQAETDAQGLGPGPPLFDICRKLASLSRRMSERPTGGRGTSLPHGRVRKSRLLGLDVLPLLLLLLLATVTGAVDPSHFWDFRGCSGPAQVDSVEGR